MFIFKAVPRLMLYPIVFSKFSEVPALPARSQSSKFMNGINTTELEKIYDTVPRTEETFSLQRSQITLDDENLGKETAIWKYRKYCAKDGWNFLTSD